MELTLKCSHYAEAKRVWPSLRGTGLFAQTRQALVLRSKKRHSSSCAPSAYLEKPEPVYDFFNKVVGALPVVGLLSRILSDKGGVGSDRIQFKEFCTRVYRTFSPDVTQAFFDFQDRHGSAARPQYVLFWCWAAAVGAGLLKSEDMMLGATRLRVTYDIVYEEENLCLLMEQAAKKRRQSKSSVPFVAYEARAEKAMEAICRCCVGKPNIEQDDAELLTKILQGVFPGAEKDEVERQVRDKVGQANKDAEGGRTGSREALDSYTDKEEEDSASRKAGERMQMQEEQQDGLNTTQLEEKSSSVV